MAEIVQDDISSVAVQRVGRPFVAQDVFITLVTYSAWASERFFPG